MPESNLPNLVHQYLSGSVAPSVVPRRGACLLYALTVGPDLTVIGNPKKPVRGQAAFETDLCLFESSGTIELPRVVAEFKGKVTTHDILTYSAKARKHNQVYPFLRYDLVVETEAVPSRAFIHNEALDCLFALGAFNEDTRFTTLRDLLLQELKASKLIERLMVDKAKVKMFRNETVIID